MDQIDKALLREMCEAICSYRSNGGCVGKLAEQLLALRDRLQFTDPPWEHNLTQHIATLDSASTFVPQNDDQKGKLSQAIVTAIDALSRLIEIKLV